MKLLTIIKAVGNICVIKSNIHWLCDSVRSVAMYDENSTNVERSTSSIYVSDYDLRKVLCGIYLFLKATKAIISIFYLDHTDVPNPWS